MALPRPPPRLPADPSGTRRAVAGLPGWEPLKGYVGSCDLVPSGLGLFMAAPGNYDFGVSQYDEVDGWTMVSRGPVDALVGNDLGLYAVMPHGVGAFQFQPSDQTWAPLGDQIRSLAGMGSRLYGIDASQRILLWDPAARDWTACGQGYAPLVVATLKTPYALVGGTVYAYDGQPGPWSAIGSPYDALYATYDNLYATSHGDGPIQPGTLMAYEPDTGAWASVDGPGGPYAAGAWLLASGDPDGMATYVYEPRLHRWIAVGGPMDRLYVGGNFLYGVKDGQGFRLNLVDALRRAPR